VLVKFELSALRRTRGRDYAVRFLFGGMVTLLAGLIADQFGPAIGGLFLAFPAIFPASASLIQMKERDKKRAAGMRGRQRGRRAAGADAAGAAMGCIGLAAFAVVVATLLARWPAWLVLSCALLAWGAGSVATWIACRRLRRIFRR